MEINTGHTASDGDTPVRGAGYETEYLFRAEMSPLMHCRLNDVETSRGCWELRAEFFRQRDNTYPNSTTTIIPPLRSRLDSKNWHRVQYLSPTSEEHRQHLPPPLIRKNLISTCARCASTGQNWRAVCLGGRLGLWVYQTKRRIYWVMN
jgi:hypothetical protein